MFYLAAGREGHPQKTSKVRPNKPDLLVRGLGQKVLGIFLDLQSLYSLEQLAEW
jgi:hypothetical protein